jgi:hypothetical protein
MAPAAAVSFNESCPKGEMMRFEVPYAAKSSELTPAIPRRGLASPSIEKMSRPGERRGRVKEMRVG